MKWSALPKFCETLVYSVLYLFKMCDNILGRGPRTCRLREREREREMPVEL
jgi:hypothetical protein